MPVRRFDGNDMVTVATPAAIQGTGEITMWALVRPTALGNAYYTLNAVDGIDYVLLIRRSGATGVVRFFDSATGNGSETTYTGFANGEWYLVGASKASASAPWRMHVYRFSTAAWTHANATGNRGNPAIGSAVSTVGAYQTVTEPLNGDLAADAVVRDNYSDGEFEGLIGASLDAWATAPSVAANGVVRLYGQASTATPIVDITGHGGDQTALTGTAVQADDPPIPYTANRTATATARPAATATGRKGGTATVAATARPSTTAAGRKESAASAAAASAPSPTVLGAKGAAGVGQSQAQPACTVNGARASTGSATCASSPAATAVGHKGATGNATAGLAPVGDADGRKAAQAVDQTFAFPSATATGEAGVEAQFGQASATAFPAAAASGVKGTGGASLAATATATTAAGVKQAADAVLATSTSTIATAGLKIAFGTATATLLPTALAVGEGDGGRPSPARVVVGSRRIGGLGTGAAATGRITTGHRSTTRIRRG